MKKGLKVLILFDAPKELKEGDDPFEELKLEDRSAEHDVYWALKRSGHDVHLLCLYSKTERLIEMVKKIKPDIVFNLAETFKSQPILESNLVSLLEMLGVPYTGTSSVGLAIAKNKGVAKKILMHHRIRTPNFWVIHRKDRYAAPKKLTYPIIIKPLREEASYGISQKSVVENDKDFFERVKFIHESMDRDVIAEEFIVGRELYVSILGADRLKVFPPREIVFSKVPEDGAKFATFRAKWDMEYRKRWGIRNQFAKDLPKELIGKINKVCKKVFKLLYLKGYGRIDLRLTDENEIVILEANPNPFIARDEDYGLSAKKGGVEYSKLIQSIVNFGIGST
jgi:D-alanine-D-alanine ligase